MRKFNLKDKAAERMMNPEAEKPAAEPKEERAESPVSGFSIASRTDVGRVRKSNQDALIIGEGIAGVADGMGGHNGGDIASGDTRDGNLRELQGNYNTLNRSAGQIEQKIDSNEERVKREAQILKEQTAVYQELGEASGELYVTWDKEYESRRRQRSAAGFRDNYQRVRKANQTVIDRELSGMKEYMMAYKTAHDFGAAATLEGYPEFEAEYVKLKDSELLKYEEKVESARQAAEEEFREQFLSKLQENMKTAQNEFKELNRALKDIHFSSERYEFLYLPSKRYRQYYEMIMDDFNILGGESLFNS